MWKSMQIIVSILADCQSAFGIVLFLMYLVDIGKVFVPSVNKTVVSEIGNVPSHVQIDQRILYPSCRIIEPVSFNFHRNFKCTNKPSSALISAEAP